MLDGTSGRLEGGKLSIARRVLESNWLGHGTRPSRVSIPRQWSWDSTCIAMGYASWNQPRAETELALSFVSGRTA